MKRWTDRNWIPLCLTKENRAKKWLGIIVLAALLFLIFWLILIFCGVAQGEDFFFQKWRMKEATITPQGFIQMTLENPDKEGKIKSVVAVALPNGTVLAYWFFNKKNEPEFWEFIGEGNYARNPSEERKCIKCHIGTQVRL